MVKEHVVSTSITNGAECICNPEILLGTNFGLWDFKNEVAPRGTLLDLNAAWELFLSRKDVFSLSFKTIEHRKHEVIDGVVYEEGDITYILLDDLGNPTGASFTIKANKGPIEHIEWEKGKLYLYYRKYRPIEDKDLESGAPLHYVTDDEGNLLYDEETGKPLIYDYVTIPIIEIFDNDETHSLFPWFADNNDVVQLRDSIDGSNGHLGSFAITPKSEVYYAKELTDDKNADLISLLSVQKQYNKDLGFEQKYELVEEYPDPDDEEYHTYRATGSNLSEKLADGLRTKESIVKVINEVFVRTKANTRLMADTIVGEDLEWSKLLEFADSIKNLAFKNSRVPNLLAAINWMQENEIGPFKEEINPEIVKQISEGEFTTVENITEALNVIFLAAEDYKDRIGYDLTNNKWIDLNTDEKDNLTEAINEVDLHVNALSDIILVQEEWDPVKKETYYSNPDLDDILKNRLRLAAFKKDDITIIEAINELQLEIGNLSTSKSGSSLVELTTNSKNSLVEAINEVDLHSDNNYDAIGALYELDSEGHKLGEITNLETKEKSNIVDAINEINSMYGNLEDLDTDNKDSIVDAINEVLKKLPIIYQDPEDPNSGVFLKDLDNTVGKESLAIGDNNNISSYSFANGLQNISSGNYTLVNGYKNNSRKLHNLINGKLNSNNGDFNLINGKLNTVIGSNNIVHGSENNVSTDNSAILGDNIITKNSTNVTAIGNNITTKDNVEDVIAIGKNSKINGDLSISIGNSNIVSLQSVTIGSGNETEGPGNYAIGDNNYIGCENSYTVGNQNRTEGNHDYVIGEGTVIKGDNNYSFGKELNIEGDNNIVIGNNIKVKTTNAITIGEFSEPKNNATNIGRDIFVETHNTVSQLQKLILVDLNDWCKKNNAASLNGEKFLNTLHVVNALKVYLTKEYTDSAILRFTMLTDNENGFIIVQGNSKRIYLNGTWYFTENITNGWSRHEGEYLKVIKKRIVTSTGDPQDKYYLAFMDLLSTEAVVDTVGGQRSNTEDFSTIDLSHAYGAVEIEDIELAMDLKNKFNSKVDKYAKIITKYLDKNGEYFNKVQDFINPDYPDVSADINLSLKDSFGFDPSEYQKVEEKGKKNGYVPLDSNGKVSSDYLPSYVDDVIDVWAEYVMLSDGNITDINLYELIIDEESELEQVKRGKPITQGETGKIYVEALPKPNGKMSYQFRWTGTKFIPIGAHITIGEVEGTAFDGGRGKAIEDAFNDHLKSGIETIPVIDEVTNELKLDENGNPMWVTYKPNPHNVKATQLPVIVNDPNNENNVELKDAYIIEHSVDSAIKTLFARLNSTEDIANASSSIIGTAEDIERLDSLDDELGNYAPTLISLVLKNKERLDSFVPIDSIEGLVSEYFNLE